MVDVRQSGPQLPPHFDVQCFPHDSLRQPVFTGPDGLYPHRSHRLVYRRPLGTNPYTQEATWDLDYLWRAPPNPYRPPSQQQQQQGRAPVQGIPAALFSDPQASLTKVQRQQRQQEQQQDPHHQEQHPQFTSTLDLPSITVGVPVNLRPRSSFAGEIGWHQFAFRNLFPEAAWTGHQMMTSEFRREVEDRWTHRYQSPWYPGEGQHPDPDRDGAYFSRFPDTGQWRPRTSQCDHVSGNHTNHSPRHPSSHSSSHSHSQGQSRSHSTSAVSLGGRSTTSTGTGQRQGAAWRRTPAATPLVLSGPNGGTQHTAHEPALDPSAVRSENGTDANPSAGDVVSVEQNSEDGEAGVGGRGGGRGGGGRRGRGGSGVGRDGGVERSRGSHQRLEPSGQQSAGPSVAGPGNTSGSLELSSSHTMDRSTSAPGQSLLLPPEQQQ